MTYMFILLTFIFGAYASTKQPDADVDILKVLTDLVNQVSVLQAEVTAQKTRISILEKLVDKHERFNSDVSDLRPKQNQSASDEYFTEEVVQIGNNNTNNFTKGVLLAPRVVGRAEGPVAFQASLNNDLTHITRHQKIAFDDVTLNLGNAYHNRHGLFIAPRPGIYIFSGSLLAHHSHGVEMQFMKNGVSLGGGILAHATDALSEFDQGSATVVTQLDNGDEVWIENVWPDDTSLRATPNTCFMGCLIMDI